MPQPQIRSGLHSGWEDVLAAVGGGLQGVDQEQTKRENRALEEKKLAQQEHIAQLHDEVRQMLTQIQQEGANQRHATPSGSVELQQEGATGRTAMTTDTTRRGQDLNFNLGQERDATTQRGQDITATTATRGQDIRSADSRYGTTTRAGVATRGQNLNDSHYWDTSNRLFEGMRLGDQRARTRDAVDAFGHDVTAARANQGTTLDDPKPVPSYKDWLGNNQQLFAPPAPDAAPAPPVRGPAPVVTPRPQTPAARPVVQPSAPGAAGGARYQPGQRVTLKSGQTVVIKAINPDGTFTY